MQVILPVAGYGKRLKPHTDTTQKTLLPVAGKSGLDHILDRLTDFGFKNFTLIIGHLGDQVIRHSKHRGENFRFIQQTDKLGLGHAVYQGLENSTDPVLVHLGDSLFNVDFKLFSGSKINQIAVYEVADPSRFGVVDLSGKNIKG
ncbi:MAG: nucleotidyltransferase family protein, partial [Candidatus Neomarinimicrobiota bacterium]